MFKMDEMFGWGGAAPEDWKAWKEPSYRRRRWCWIDVRRGVNSSAGRPNTCLAALFKINDGTSAVIQHDRMWKYISIKHMTNIERYFFFFIQKLDLEK